MTEPAFYGKDLFGEPKKPVTMKGILAEKFSIPPFSVLNAREGWWQNRKKAWIRLGIQSEVGRGGVTDERSAGESWMRPTASLKDGLTYGLTQQPYQDPEEVKKKEERIVNAKVRQEKTALIKEGEIEGKEPVHLHARTTQGPGQPGLMQNLTCAAYRSRGKEVSASDCGTSIFDPVICEMAYRWFAPPGGQIVDPFAGGSVRGIVAGMLGFRYWGCDLSAVQIQANVKQGELLGDRRSSVEWVNGDSTERMAEAPEADFLFSCPPYGDLEEYSKDPRDLSTMDYADFREAYARIIDAACQRLRPDRFACFVVGDFRDPKTGVYRHFHADTTTAFKRAGLGLYNQAILVTAVGSLSIRVARQFNRSRKMGMTHQMVLVYCKGDPVKATQAITGETESK